MASRGPRSRYYPGANSLTLFSAQGSNPLEDCKVYGKGVQKVYDRSVKGYVYSINGGLQSKLQLPKHDSKAGLQLLHHFLVFQVYVPPGQHFSIELRVSDSNNTRRKMYFSTSFSEIKTTPLHCQIPISMVIRNKWLSLSFHVADLFNSCFRGGVSFRSIDIIVLGPVCKIRKIFTMRCRITETSPHGYFEEASEYCLPQEHLYQVGVDSCIQIVDMAALQSAEVHNAETNFGDSRPVVGSESERSARKGAQGKTENSRIVHVAFGTRMPLPLSTVQINTSLPHDNKCPPFSKEQNGRLLPNESVLCEPKAVPNMVTRALTAATMHHDTEGLRRKVDKVLADCKTKRGTQHYGSVAAPYVPFTDEKDAATSPRETATEPDSACHDTNSQPALEPLPDSPATCNASTETHNGFDSTNKSPSKWQGARKKDCQTSLQAKQHRKESQARSKEYKPSRYMDSPPGSPPCGWDSTTGAKKTEDNAFSAHFLEGSWINNQISEPVESGKPYCLANSLKQKILLSMSHCDPARLDDEEMTGAIHRDRLKLSIDHNLHHSAGLLYCNSGKSDKSSRGGRYSSVYTDSMFGKKVHESDERNLSKTSGVKTGGESSGGQSWSSVSSDHFEEESDAPLFISGGVSSAAAEKLGRGPRIQPDLLGRLPTPPLTKDLPKKDSEREEKLMFDPQDELLFEKLLSESKKDMLGADRLKNGNLSKSLTKGVEDFLDFETEADRVRDALDISFEEALLKMKGSRDTDSFIVEPVRSAFDDDSLQTSKSWQLLTQPPVTKPPSRQTARQDDEGFVVNKGRPEEDLDLLYDPTLDCYYDPKTNRYYELK